MPQRVLTCPSLGSLIITGWLAITMQLCLDESYTELCAACSSLAGASLFGSARLLGCHRNCSVQASLKVRFVAVDLAMLDANFSQGRHQTVHSVESEASGSTASPFGGGSGSRLSLQATDAELRRLIGPTAAPTAQDRIKRPLWWL